MKRIRLSISQRNLCKGIRTWYIGNGISGWQSLGTEKKSEAQAALDRRNAERFLPQSEREQKLVSPAEAAQAFLKDAEGETHCLRFRHSFASNLIRAGKSIKAVQTLMRHSDIAT